MDVKQKLTELINNGNDIINQSCYGVDGYTYYSGDLYEQWISECELFLDNFYKEQEIVNKFKRAGSHAVGNGREYFNEMIGILKVLLKQNDIINLNSDEDKKIEKIFISHSTEDEEYVGLFIQLLNSIGIPKDREFILCSSYEGYDISAEEKIYDFIENEFDKNVWAIFMLSNNYYKSIPCLNEMGAVWVTKKDYTSIMLPDFNMQQTNGAIDAVKNAFYISDAENINAFKDKIIEVFDLDPIDRNAWNKNRTNFLSEIKKLEDRDKNKNAFIKVDVKKVKKINRYFIQAELRLINDTNTPIEFTQILLTLIDEDNNKYTFDVCDMENVKKIVYGQERRREVIDVELIDTKYDPIKHKTFEWESRWVQGY